MFGGFGFAHHHQTRAMNIQANFPPHNVNDESYWDLEQIDYRVNRSPQDINEYNETLDKRLAEVVQWLETQKEQFAAEINSRVARWNSLRASRIAFEERKQENKLNIRYTDPDSPWRALLDGRDIFTVIFTFLSVQDLLGKVQHVCWDFLNIIQEYVPQNVDLSCDLLGRYPMDAILGKYRVERLTFNASAQGYGFGANNLVNVIEVVKTLLTKNEKLKGLSIPVETGGIHYGHVSNSDDCDNFLKTLSEYKCAASLEELSIGLGIPEGLHKFVNVHTLSIAVFPGINANPYGTFGHVQQTDERKAALRERFVQLTNYISTHKKLKKLTVDFLPSTKDEYTEMCEAIRANRNITHLRIGIAHTRQIHGLIAGTGTADATDHSQELVDYLMSDQCSIETLEIFNSVKNYYAGQNPQYSATHDIVETLSNSYAQLSPTIKKIVVDVNAVYATAWNLLGKPGASVQLNSEFVQGKVVSEYLDCLDASDIAVTSFTLREYQLIMNSSKTAAEKFIGSNSENLKHLTIGNIRGKHAKSINYFLTNLKKNTHLETLTLYTNHVSVNDSTVLDAIANIIHEDHPSLRSLRILHQKEANNGYPYYQRRKRLSNDLPAVEAEDSPPLVAIQDEIIEMLGKADCKVKEIVLQGAHNNFNARMEHAIYVRQYGETRYRPSSSMSMSQPVIDSSLTIEDDDEAETDTQTTTKKRKRTATNGEASKRGRKSAKIS